MKKVIFSALMFSFGVLSAQSLEIIDAVNEVIVDTKISPTEVHIGIKNTTADTIEARAFKTVIQDVTGTENYFCWDVCLPPNTDTAGSVKINPGDTTNGFKGYYEHNSIKGTAIVKYCFYKTTDISDSVCINISYNNGTIGGLSDNAYKSEVSVFPNPAKDFVNISFTNLSWDSSFRMYDILGNVILEKTNLIGSGSFALETSSFSNGIYVYTLSDNSGIIKTDKLVINK